MGKVKEALMEYEIKVLGRNKETPIEIFIDKYAFLKSVDKILFSATNDDIDTTLQKFFDAIIFKENFIHKPYRLSVYGKKKIHKYLKWCSYEEFLKYASKIKDYAGLNAYYLPLPFRNENSEEKDAGQTKCFYVDIDGIELNITGETHEERRCEIMELLMNEYNVPYESLPPFVVCSGHGLHLYFTIPPAPADNEHKEKVRRVYAYFKGDFSGVSPAHLIRVPNSYNAKEDPVRSELFFIREPEYSWEYIEPLMASEEETAIVYKAYNAAKAEKRRCTNEAKKEREIAAETRKKKENKTKKKFSVSENDAELLIDYTEADSVLKSNDIDVLKTPSTCDELSYFVEDDFDIDIEPPKEKKIIRKSAYINTSYTDLPLKSNSMFSRRVTDLLNYYNRRNRNIKGYRNIFFTILVYTFKAWGTTKEETESQCLVLVECDFETELLQIIEKAYNNNTTYKYTNETIAELLNFQKYDYEHSYSCYRKQDRVERERLRGQKRYEPIKNKNKNKKDKIKSTIVQNPQMTNKQLAEMFGVTTRTITNYRKVVNTI